MAQAELLSMLSSLTAELLGFFIVITLRVDWRFSRRTTFWSLLAFLAALTGIVLLIFTRAGVSNLTKMLSSVLFWVCSLLFHLFFTRWPVYQAFAFFNATVFVFLADMLSTLLYPGPSLLHILVKIVLFPLFTLLLRYVFRPPFMRIMRLAGPRLLWVTPVPAFLFVLYYRVVHPLDSFYRSPEFRPTILLLSVCTVLLYLFFYILLSALLRHLQMRADYRLLQTHVASIEMHTETMQSMENRLRMLRHDIRHYIRIQECCLESGDIAGVRETLSSMQKRLDEVSAGTRSQRFTGHPLMDTVLTFYMEKSLAREISMQVRLQLPQKLKNEAELAVVLSNALDNAVNACLKLASGREIRVSGQNQEGQLFLECANTCTGEVRFSSDGVPVSPVPGHGYGSQSISFFAQKYGAILNYRVENGWFRLQLLL